MANRLHNLRQWWHRHPRIRKTTYVLLSIPVVGWLAFRIYFTVFPFQPPRPDAFPVKLATATAVNIERSSRYVGTMDSEEAVRVRSETAGRIVEILVSEGEKIDSGELLFRLRPDKLSAELASERANAEQSRSDLQATRSEVRSQEAEFKLARSNYIRAREAFEDGLVSRQELDDAESRYDASKSGLEAARSRAAQARASLSRARANARLANEKFQDTLIRAPQDGIVGNIDLDVGDYVSVGDTLVSITENRNLELSLAIPLARAQEAEVGTPVLVRERGQAIAGEIFFLAPQIQRDSQTMRIKAKFPNAGNKLRDGQFVRAEVIWEEIPDAIMIPTTAVVFEGDKRTVYLAEPLPEKTGSSQDSGGFELAKLLPFLPAGNGQSPTHRAVAHSVKTGLTRRDRIQITSGLEAGQKYVRAGVQKAFDGAKLIALPTSEAEN